MIRAFLSLCETHLKAHTTCLLSAPISVCVPEHQRLLVGKRCWRTEDETDIDEYEIEEENQTIQDITERLLLQPESTPLLVFVNTKSGGQQGHFLLRKLRSLLNPSQVIDINLQGPGPALSTFRSVRNGRILVCGGDGTVGWVLSVLDQYDDWKPPVCLFFFCLSSSIHSIHSSIQSIQSIQSINPSIAIFFVDQNEGLTM